jgi:hypothetical protein
MELKYINNINTIIFFNVLKNINNTLLLFIIIIKVRII